MSKKTTSGQTREDLLKQAFARAQRDQQGERVTSLAVGENIFWPIADTNGRTYLRLQHHDGKAKGDGEFYQPSLDLSQIDSPNSVVYRILKDRLTDDNEIKLFAEFGDPAVRLFNILTKDLDYSYTDVVKFKPNPARKTYYYINAYYNDMLVVLRIPKTVFSDMVDHDEWPSEIVGNPDLAFRVTADDNGPYRNYKSPKVTKQTRPENLQLEPYDLGDVVSRLYMPYSKKVTWLFRSYGQLLEVAQLTPESFGVKELVD